MNGRWAGGVVGAKNFSPLRGPTNEIDRKTDNMHLTTAKNKMPDGWVITTVGDVFDFQYGKSLPRKKRNPEGNYPVYGSNGQAGL